MSLTYFAADGNYGEWDGRSLIIDTSKWTEGDWAAIDASTDLSRVETAYQISMEHLKAGE